jgi:hypothetical protein
MLQRTIGGYSRYRQHLQRRKIMFNNNDFAQFATSASEATKKALDSLAERAGSLAEVGKTEVAAYSEFAGELCSAKTPDVAFNALIAYQTKAFQRFVIAATKVAEQNADALKGFAATKA